MHSDMFCFSSSRSQIYDLIGNRRLHVHEAPKAVKDPYSFIYLSYFEIMSGFAGFIVIHDHN
jgi:hypothetical protein